MPIKLEELLKRLPSDTQERVARANKRFNNNIREALRQETGLRLNRDNQTAPSESVNVPISLMPGLPTALRDRLELSDQDRRIAILAPHAQVLRELRDGCGTLLQEATDWCSDDLLADLLYCNWEPIGQVQSLAETLLKEIERRNLVQWLLEVDEDVLGVYRYTYGGYSESQGIELYWGIIGLVSKWLAVPVEDLTVVILAHELAHAYTHLGLDIDGQRWPTPSFAGADHAIKEGLAQYYTVRVLSRMQTAGSGPMEAYNRLLPDQPEAYQVHVPWIAQHTPEIVRAAMLQIRRVSQPELNDFSNALQDVNGKLRGPSQMSPT